MKIRRIAGVVVVAIAAVPAGLAVAGSSGLKVTGGGQVLVDGATGPGDTIAFNAQQDGPLDMDGVADAKGQLQVINRTAGTGQAAVKFHGLVTCIRVFNADQDTADPSDDERYIRFGGFQTVKGKQTANAFTVDTQDNGEGMNALEADQILFRQRGDIDEPCDDDEITTELRSPTLARGNVQEHKQSSNTSSTKSRPSSAKSTATRLSVLR